MGVKPLTLPPQKTILRGVGKLFARCRVGGAAMAIARGAGYNCCLREKAKDRTVGSRQTGDTG